MWKLMNLVVYFLMFCFCFQLLLLCYVVRLHIDRYVVNHIKHGFNFGNAGYK